MNLFWHFWVPTWGRTVTDLPNLSWDSFNETVAPLIFVLHEEKWKLDLSPKRKALETTRNNKGECDTISRSEPQTRFCLFPHFRWGLQLIHPKKRVKKNPRMALVPFPSWATQTVKVIQMMLAIASAQHTSELQVKKKTQLGWRVNTWWWVKGGFKADRILLKTHQFSTTLSKRSLVYRCIFFTKKSLVMRQVELQPLTYRSFGGPHNPINNWIRGPPWTLFVESNESPEFPRIWGFWDSRAEDTNRINMLQNGAHLTKMCTFGPPPSFFIQLKNWMILQPPLWNPQLLMIIAILLTHHDTIICRPKSKMNNTWATNKARPDTFHWNTGCLIGILKWWFTI